MANTQVPNIFEIYFRHKKLTRISRPTNFGSLKTLADKLKANARSVPSVLGGGQYRHLGLLLTSPQYATLPLVSPINLEPFDTPDKGTEAQINAARDSRLMEGEALHFSPKPSSGKSPCCSGGLCSRASLSYSSAQAANRPLGSNVLAILQHHFTTYGHITPQQLKTREMEFCNMHFHMTLPVNAIFNTIDGLLELAENALMPMFSTQAVILVYVVF